MTQKMKALLIDTLSGTNDYAVELAASLSLIVDLTVFTVSNSKVARSSHLRVIEGFPAYGERLPKWRKALSAVRSVSRLASNLWRHRNGVIHVQFLRFPLLEWPLYAVMRPFLRCLVVTAHNVSPHEKGRIATAAYTCVYKMADRIHVLSRNVGDRIAERFGIPQERIDYVPHGNYEQFRAREVSNRKDVANVFGRPLSAESIVIAFVGMVRPYKGLLNLARAYESIDRPNTVLVVAGKIEPSAREELEAVEKLRQPDKEVLVIGRFLPDAELAAIMDRVDVVAFPYRDISQSGALMLAMTFGKAVVANDIQGFREYVRHNQTGILCDTENSEVFAASLRELVDDPSKRRALGQAARNEMIETYEWSGIARELLKTYEKALSN